MLRAIPILAAAAAISTCAAPKPADAWGRVGVFIGVPPIFVGGPLFYPAPIIVEPPPVYYAPPPAYYPPPGDAAPEGQPAPAGYTCYAKPYQCPLYEPHKPGDPCACEALGGGVVSGTVQ